MHSKLQILTHSVQFFDTLSMHTQKMFKKLLKILTKPKFSKYVDAKIWIQKILLEEKFGKIN